MVSASLCLALLASPLSATETRVVEGHAYPVAVAVADAQLRLVGAGDADWGFFDINTAALYLPPDGDRGQPLLRGPVRLTIRYQRSFSAEDFAEATTSTFGKDLDQAGRARFAEPLAALNRLYGPRRAGEEWRLTWLPGSGLELSDETRVLGVVPGDEFARRVLAIWLGDPPVDKRLRAALIGR